MIRFIRVFMRFRQPMKIFIHFKTNLLVDDFVYRIRYFSFITKIITFEQPPRIDVI